MTGQRPDPEYTALKREFDSLREEVAALRDRQHARTQELVQTLRAFGLSGEEIEAHVSALVDHGLTRRAALLAVIGAVGGAGYLAGVETARADAVGQVGTSADPLTKLWTHEIESGDGADALSFGDAVAFDHEAVNSATTIGNVTVVYYDTSVSGFTITIPASLEKDGVVLRFIDQTGNAGSNAVTITANSNIDGGANITVNHDHAVTTLLWDGSEWRSTRFIDSVDTSKLVFPVETPARNVAGSRSFNSWFSNSESVPIMVFVAAQASSADTRIGLNIYANSSETQSVRKDQQAITVGNNDIVNVQGIIGVGENYQVTDFGDTADFSLLRWNEYKVGEA